MARTFKGADLSLPISDEVREFLLSKGQDVMVQQLDQQWENMKPREEAAEVNEDEDYSEWSLTELQDEAKERGISPSGTKAEIAGRLEKDDAENAS